VLKETLLKFLKLDGLIDNLTGYVETRIELMKIEIKEEVAKGMAKAMVLLVMMAVLMLAVLMVSTAVAYKIADSVGAFAGFGIVGGFYVIVGLAIYLLRKPISEVLEKRLDEKMKSKKSDDAVD
jgi:uncharacterized membrane protein YqjE